MKTFTKTALCSAACSLLLSIGSMQAQTMTGTIVQPCNNNGQINVTVTGLTAPISYSYTNWMAGQSVVHANMPSTSDVLTNIAAYQAPWGNANIWNVVASDGVNTVNQSFTLTAPFSVSDSVQVASCPALSTVQATFFGGTAPYSCVWTNQTTLQTFLTNPAAVPNGPYGLVATDGAGCMVSTTTFSGGIYVSSISGIVVNMTGTSANCTNGTAMATASGGTAPYTYLWNNAATTQNISGLSQGWYNCIVTDAIGCQSTGNYYVSQAISINYNPTITNATCVQNNGSILGFVNGGTAPYTFLWSNGATTQNISGLTGGQQYIVQITDANGCTATGYPYVGVTTPISVTYSTTASSCTAATGSATLIATGGLAPYSIVWNTFPSTTGASISNKMSGNYAFTVTDANGCIRTGVVVIPPNSTINASMNNSSVVCPVNTGNLSVTVSGTNPPFTYAWNNGGTTSAITGVALGSYNCVITDAVGCSIIRYGSVFQTSPINVGFTTTQASCIYVADGAATANPTGGTAPYTYLWSNAQTGATATGLATGNYYVTVADANGCQNNFYNSQTFVGYNAANNSCYCTITGTVYTDTNNDCVRNAGENGIPNIQMHCSGIGYAYTNANGVYSFMAPTGSYIISESVQQIYPLATCQNNNLSVSVTAGTNCSTTVDFANNVVVLSDLHIITTNFNQPVPGNPYTQQVIVQNEGTTTESGVQLGYTHDGQLAYNNSAPWALTQQNPGSYPNWYSITSGFPSLAPGASTSSYINYNVAVNVPLGTMVNFFDSVARVAPIATSWLTDNTPWNNVNSHQAIVVGSYDPNFKEVSPKGVGPQGDILTSDSLLTYVVHFQNTGSYYAQNIVVVDSLDADLRMATLRPGYSNHQYTTTISETGVIKFSFKNINLPWKSAYGDVLSSGMFTYSIKLKKNLPVGTQIKNKAAIYFDYNEPVITNTTLNTIAAPTALKDLDRTSDRALLFPNPASNYFTLLVSGVQSANGMLKIFDISGREISSKNIELQAGQNRLTENTAHLQNGIYFVQLKTATTLVEKKLVIAK